MAGMEVQKRPVTVPSIDEIKEQLENEKENQAKRMWLVAISAVGQNNLLYEKSTHSLYVQREDEQFYRKLDNYEERQLAMAHMLQFGQAFLPKQINDTVELVKANAPMVERTSTDCIMISKHLFWDKENGTINFEPTAPVFHRLFDTTNDGGKVVKVTPFTEEQEQQFIETYETVKKELEEGIEKERFDLLKVWANGSHDIYMDLHRAHAYCFLKKKPLGVYLLTGLRRNGKSTYIYLTHTIFGRNNTSMLQLTELGNHHRNLSLRHSLMNAPDEEKDKTIPEQGLFKTLADHGAIELDVLYQQEPALVDCDFMCFHPMNHTPEWEGSGAAACMNRSLIIPFTASLDKSDSSSEDFNRSHFTADFFAEYLGSVFAYAYYYHRHNFDFSETMKREQSILESDLDSTITYVNLFSKYFYGFSSYKLLYADYFAWCKAEDVKPQKLKDLKNTASKLIRGLERKSAKVDDMVSKAYVGKKTLQHQQIFSENVYFSELKMTVKDLHGRSNNVEQSDGKSVIEELELYYLRKVTGWA